MSKLAEVKANLIKKNTIGFNDKDVRKIDKELRERIEKAPTVSMAELERRCDEPRKVSKEALELINKAPEVSMAELEAICKPVATPYIE